MAINQRFVKQVVHPTRSAWASLRRNSGLWFRLVPALGLIILLYLGGLIMAFVQSMGYFPALGMLDVSFDAYLNLFHRPDFLSSLSLTLWVSLISTITASILALTAALLLRSVATGKPWLTFLFELNLPIPHIVGAIGIYLLLNQSGLFARLAYLGGLIQTPADFPALVFDKYAIGIIFEYVWKTSVFLGVNLLAALQTLGEDYEAVASTLGANSWQRFRNVIFPLLKPTLISSSILVFAFTFGGYEVPYILGQRSNSLLPVLAYREYNQLDLTARPQAMAMSMVITLIISILIWLYMKISRKSVR